MHRARAAALTAVALVGCLTACTDGSAPRADESSSASSGTTGPAASAAPTAPDDTTSTPDDTATSAAATAEPVPGDVETTAPRVQPSGTPGDLTAVTVAEVDGTDTVTFQFAGDGLPPYQVEYRDVLMRGDDDPILLAGDAVLVVTFEDATPGAGGVTGDDVVTNEEYDQQVVRQVVLAKNLGGTVVYGLGLARQVPFTVEEDRDGGTLTVRLVH